MAGVDAISTQPPTTKAGVVEAYQKKYQKLGKDGWKQNIVRDLAKLTGMKEKNLDRRFNPSRLNNVPRRKAEQQQYIELGKQFGPLPPRYGYHVKFYGWVRFSHCEKRGSREAPLDVDITGAWAKEVAKDPSLLEAAILLIYLEEDNQRQSLSDQAPSVGFCEDDEEDNVKHDPVVVVSKRNRAAGKQVRRARRFSFFR